MNNQNDGGSTSFEARSRAAQDRLEDAIRRHLAGSPGALDECYAAALLYGLIWRLIGR